MSTDLFLLAAQVGLGVTGLLALVTFVAWLRKMNLRFALVGYTAFCLVLTVGCYALTLTPIMKTSIPGAARFSTVYDRGANQAVIKVDRKITPDQLRLTLEQAALNLGSSGRYSADGSRQFRVRARTVLHPEKGVSVPLYLGEIERTMGRQSEAEPRITINAEAFEQLQAASSQEQG
jgi:hypothetical protein